ncbi:MAG TPA: protein-disulfide reductase DsbD domain-containing protein [Chitinophagaceae bacterium]|nr:protein-disulfide reductase DsbD domain-containing protein [Chitinophagaceae bacterium]
MKHLLPILALLVTSSLLAQSDKEVQWTFAAKKISDNVYEIHMTAKVNDDWHIYSQEAGEGPFATSITFAKNPLIQLDGKVKEAGKLKKVYEKSFDSEVRYYENTVNFVQVVKLKGKAKTNLAGKVEFMVCNDSRCLPPAAVDFKINIGG